MENKMVTKHDDVDYQFMLDSEKFPELKKEFDDYDKIRNIYKFFHSTLKRYTKDVKKICLGKINGEIGKNHQFGIFNYKMDFKNTTSNFKAKNLLSRLNINRGLVEKEMKIESLGAPSLDGRIGYIRSHQMANLEKLSNGKFKELVDFISSSPKYEAISVVWAIDKKLSDMVEDKKDKIKDSIKQLMENGDIPISDDFVRYQIMFDSNICYEKTSRNHFSTSKLINEISNIYNFNKDRPFFISEDQFDEKKYHILSQIDAKDINNINSPKELKGILENNNIDPGQSKEFKDALKLNSVLYVVSYTNEMASLLENNKKGFLVNIEEFKKSEALLNSIIDLSKDLILVESNDKDRDLISRTLSNLSSSKNNEEVSYGKEYMVPDISKEEFIERLESEDLKSFISDTYSKYLKISEQKNPIEFCSDYISREILSETLSPVNIRSKNDHRAILRSNMEENSLEYIKSIMDNYPEKGISESDDIQQRIFKEMIGEDDEMMFNDKNNDFDIDEFLSIYENDNNLSSVETKDYVDLNEFELNGGNFIGYIKYLKLNCFNPEQVSYSNKIYENFTREKDLKDDMKKINKMESNFSM